MVDLREQRSQVGLYLETHRKKEAVCLVKGKNERDQPVLIIVAIKDVNWGDAVSTRPGQQQTCCLSRDFCEPLAKISLCTPSALGF